MTFHDFPLFYLAYKRRGNLPRGVDAGRFYASHAASVTDVEPGESDSIRAHLLMEGWWAVNNRPFYNVWPKIIPMLTRLDLSQLQGNMMKPRYKTVCLRFPVQDNPLTFNGVTLRSLLVGPVETPRGYGYFTAQDYGEVENGYSTITTDWVTMYQDRSLAETLAGRKQRPSATHGLPIPIEITMDAWRLVFTLALLDDDPELIERIVLAADRDNYERTGDQKYVAKAERRGVLGWDIGKRIEVMPHYRRPHLGLRWCGEGRTQARIVPIKGAIIHREAVVKMPTGEEGPA